jgi:hypothetical protein
MMSLTRMHYKQVYSNVEGFNGVLPDFDIIESARKAVEVQTEFYSYDNLNFVTNSAMLQSLSPVLRDICTTIFDFSRGVLGPYGVELYRPDENSFPFLMQFWGSQIFGRISDVHPFFLL